jgi:uridine phosphorylase
MSKLSEADLIINADGSIYHLNLLPEDVANTVITVGDPERIPSITKYFDHIELKKGKREFLTQTGYIGPKRITVLSTGIGTDNIDIVFNELDALVNIDFNTRQVKERLSSLNLIRLGTSGAVQGDVPMGTVLASSHGLGLDSLMHYYEHEGAKDETDLLEAILAHFAEHPDIHPYLTAADPGLLSSIGLGMEQGITVTAPGFYGPQGRQVRAKNKIPGFIPLLNSFHYNNYRITNLEMETAGIYALAKLLGHKALSVNAILASRINFQFSNEPDVIVDNAIKLVLERIIGLPD